MALQDQIKEIKVAVAKLSSRIDVVDNIKTEVRKLSARLPHTDAESSDVDVGENNLVSELVKLRSENGILKAHYRRSSLRKVSASSGTKKVEIIGDDMHGNGSTSRDTNLDKSLNVRVYGLPEVPCGETIDDCIQTCMDVFSEILGVSVTKDDISTAQRFGRMIAGGARPRPVIVTFLNRRARGDVLISARQKLKHATTGILVGEDLTVATYKMLQKGDPSGWDLVVNSTATKWNNISYRLSRRKALIRRRCRLVDVACLLALLGVITMLVEAELFIQNYTSKQGSVSLSIKLAISLSTVCLLLAILAYHITGIRLSMVDNGIDDWRLFTRAPLVASIVAEFVVCSVHPVPGSVSNLVSHTMESMLSILMFLRLYLGARFLVVHSYLVTNSATQSLGALNKVRINAIFVFKALMSEIPGTLLMCLMLTIFILSSWSVRTCEAYMVLFTNNTEDVPAQTLADATWLSAITFLTVGYGDVVPHSDCGRVMAVVTGMLGVGTTALLVAVLAQKVEQSRSEKYVHAFVSRLALDKVHKNAAADVIKNVLKLWRIKHCDRQDAAAAATGDTVRRKKKLLLPGWRVNVHGKLLQAVREMRDAKTAKAHIGESAVGVIEVNTAVTEVVQITETISEQQEMLSARCESMENRLTSIEHTLDKIAQAVL